jgi:hypothetical protein
MTPTRRSAGRSLDGLRALGLVVDHQDDRDSDNSDENQDHWFIPL